MPKRSRPAEAPAPQASPYLEMNIGGYIVGTTRALLARAPAGRLRALADDATDVVRDDDGRIFFDRDGVAFEALLTYLRTETLVVPRDSTVARVRREVEFFFDDVRPYIFTEAAYALLDDEGFLNLVLVMRNVARRMVQRARAKRALEQTFMHRRWFMKFEQGPDPELTDIASLEVAFTRSPQRDDTTSVSERLCVWFMQHMSTTEKADALACALESSLGASSVFVTVTDADVDVRVVYDATSSTYKALAAAVAEATDEQPTRVEAAQSEAAL
jgi:hypothetical protein